MSLLHTVVALITQAGSGTRDTVLSQCPGYTAEKVSRALNNAAYKGLIHRAGSVGRPGSTICLGLYKPGLSPTKAAAAAAPYRRPVASVWELGSRAMAG